MSHARVSIFGRKLTWVLLGWTAAAIGVCVLARFTFAAPVPSICRPGVDTSGCGYWDFRPLWYFFIAFVWLVGLVAICLIAWRRAEGPPAPRCTFLLKTADGAPAKPPSIETVARSWHPGDKIWFSRKTMQVIGVHEGDSDKPTVLIVEDMSA
jgi:hypothetical protein